MPELAEVEYFRKQWDAGIGDKIIAVQLHRKKRIFRGTNVSAVARRLTNQHLLRSTTRGKQIFLVFSGDNWMGIHLGMSGHLRVESADFSSGKHDHLVLRQAKRALVLKDARQFGRVRFHYGADEPTWWKALAPEIHSRQFTRTRMIEFVRRHGRAPIKAILLLQSGFSGIGNWMADEILWRARIGPRLKGAELTAAQLSLLWRSTRFVARASLRTLGRDNTDPPRGWLLHERWAAGGKCPRDHQVLLRATIGGRTTAWCARCQR